MICFAFATTSRMNSSVKGVTGSPGCASRKAAHVQKGKKPSEERISNFIARIAAHEETNGLEPIDKASLRVLANYQAVTKVKA